MRRTTTAERMRELQVTASAAALLARMFTPHLVRGFVERLELEDRVRRRRMSRRERRIRRSLRMGVYGAVLAAAGVAAARMATHDAQGGDRAPEIDGA